MFKNYKRVKEYGTKGDKAVYALGTGFQVGAAPIGYVAAGMLGPVGWFVGGLTYVFGAMYKRATKESIKTEMYLKGDNLEEVVKKETKKEKRAKKKQEKYEKKKQEKAEKYANKQRSKSKKKDSEKKKDKEYEINKELKKFQKYIKNPEKKKHGKYELKAKNMGLNFEGKFKFKYDTKKNDYEVKIKDKGKKKNGKYDCVSIPKNIESFNELESIIVSSSS